MTAKLVYVVSLEISPKKGSQMWGKAKGGYLFCVVRSIDAREAIEKCCAALIEDKYKIVLVEEVIKSENMDWDNSTDEGQLLRLAQECQDDDEVRYSPISTFNEE